MARRVREHDRAATPLGPPDRWPFALRGAVALVLDHPLPMALGRSFRDVGEEVHAAT